MHRNTNRTTRSTFTLFCLLVLGTLVFLAACGSNSNSTTGSSSATATSDTSSSSTDNSGGYGYGGGKYGNTTTPTATKAVSGPTQTVMITTDSSGAFTFSPKTLTIKVGTTVIWQNTTQAPHTVTSDDGKTFNAGSVAPGTTFSFKFTAKGTFAYHCNFHPYMKATIVVQ